MYTREVQDKLMALEREKHILLRDDGDAALRRNVLETNDAPPATTIANLLSANGEALVTLRARLCDLDQQLRPVSRERGPATSGTGGIPPKDPAPTVMNILCQHNDEILSAIHQLNDIYSRLQL